MSADTQTHLFGEPSGESVSIETTGRVVRPMMAVPDCIVDESKVEFADDGIHFRAVDPANVSMAALNVEPEAFDHYELDGEAFTTGFNLRSVTRQLRRARMGRGTDDPVEVEVDQTRVLVTTRREYSQTTLTQTGEVLTIDPDSIRKRPDIPDLRWPWKAEVDVNALVDAVTDLKEVADHVEIRERDGHLMFGATNDSATGDYGHVADFGEVVESADDDVDESDHDASAKYSMDYMADLVEGIKDAKADEVTVRWADEFPVKLEFCRYAGDGETVAYSGVMMVAPRIKAEDS